VKIVDDASTTDDGRCEGQGAWVTRRRADESAAAVPRCRGFDSGRDVGDRIAQAAARDGGPRACVDAPAGNVIAAREDYAAAMRSRPLPRWLGPFYLIAGFALLPWSVGLAITLPATAKTTHYGAAWFGFDLLLGALLCRTGWLALRRRANIELTAAATATMLVVDAWFDTMTSDTHDQFILALVLAFCAELPLAGLCLYIAGSVELHRQRQQLASHRLVRHLVAALERGRRAAPSTPPIGLEGAED
jgi:hypothetical protein